MMPSMFDPAVSDEPWPSLPEHLLGLAATQSFNAILITDASPGPEGPRILYVNPAFCKMTGYASHELLGRTPRMLQGPQTSRDVLAELRACLAEGRFFRGSTVNYRKDGSPYTVEWNISAVRDDAGCITHFVSVQQDLSAYMAVQTASSLLAQALDASPDAVIITNAQGVIEFANRGVEVITGYSLSDVIGRTPALFQSGQHDDAFYQRLWHTLQAGETFRATFVNRHKRGHLIHCEETISPVRLQQAGITHFVSIIKDLTDRVHAEQTLREQATQDGLTGLLNRRAGELQLESAYFAARELSKPFCVMLVDVDHFKAINDTHGHLVGDAVLQRLARVLRTSVRGTDHVARWGGEEFLLILPGCELAAALELAERIRARVHGTGFDEVGVVTSSVGVAQIRLDETLAGLIDRADKALYAAKRAGRNQVCSG